MREITNQGCRGYLGLVNFDDRIKTIQGFLRPSEKVT